MNKYIFVDYYFGSLFSLFFFLKSSIKENESTLLLSVFLFLKFLLTENRISRKNFHLKLPLCCFFFYFTLMLVSFHFLFF
jgi:hypothetical protein